MSLKLNELDLENIADWPIAVKIVCATLVFVVILAAGYFFDTENLQSQLNYLQSQEITLKEQLRVKQRKASSLKAYKVQIKEIRELFRTLLKQLPNSREIPALIDSISYAGLDAGLTFTLIQPQKKEKKDFYEMLPITIAVKGTYNQLGQFISSIAALPRIVTINDFDLHRLDDKDKSKTQAEDKDRLVLNMNAMTYRYLTQEEQNNDAKKKNK